MIEVYLLRLIKSVLTQPPNPTIIDETDTEFEERLEQRIEETHNNNDEDTLDLDSSLVCAEDYGKI